MAPRRAHLLFAIAVAGALLRVASGQLPAGEFIASLGAPRFPRPCANFSSFGPHTSGTCQVVIAPTQSGVIKQLSLADVKLYDSFGGDIFSAAAVFWQSSVNVVYGAWGSQQQQPASNCNDGNLATICATASTWSDSNPVLRIYYSCPLGSTSLSRVVVTSDPNRRDALSVFSLIFVNGENVADRPTYPFSGAQQTYTIPTTGMHRHAYICAQPRLSLCRGHPSTGVDLPPHRAQAVAAW